MSAIVGQVLDNLKSPGRSVGMKTFPAFDGLCGYMAWWVVIGHALHLCGLQKLAPALLMRVDIAVNVFICLSGFVITHLLLEKDEGYGRYLLRRGFRIFPIYWFALLVALLATPAYDLVYQGQWVAEREMRLARETAVDGSFMTHLLLHLPLLHGIVPDTVLPFSSSALLAPAWSLSLEWQFYLVAPMLIALLNGGWLKRVMTLAVLLGVWITFRKWVPWQWKYPAALPLALNFFFVGILSRLYFLQLAKVMGAVLPAALLFAVVGPRSMRVEVLIWAGFLTAALIQHRDATGDVVVPTWPGRVLQLASSNLIARRLGEVSYSTYLVHVPLFCVTGWIAAAWLGRWDQSVAIMSTVLACALMVPLAFFLYAVIERPCVQLGSRFGRVRDQRVQAQVGKAAW